MNGAAWFLVVREHLQGWMVIKEVKVATVSHFVSIREISWPVRYG